MDNEKLELGQADLSNELLQTLQEINVNVQSLHQDLVLTNTLLSVLIGAFAVYCFFRFLFKG